MSDEPVKKPRVGRIAGKGCTYLSGGRWYYQWTDPVTHKTRALSSGSDDRAVADAKLQEVLDKLAKGDTDPGATELLTVQNLLTDLLRDYEVSKFSTLDDCESRLRLHLAPAFGRMKATRLRNTHCQRFILARREEKASDATIANELGLLRRAFNLAVENGRLSVAPFIGLPAGYDVPRQGFLEPAQFRVLMSHLNENLKPLACLAFFTGMRRGELLSLRWQDVDLVEGTIRLSAAATKTRTARTIPIAAEPLAMLRVSKVRRDQVDPTCDAVFFRERRKNDCPGGPLVQLGDFRRDWMDACEKAGLPELLFHDLRRSGVRMLIRSGVDEHTAMRISGHVTRSIFARYDIISLDDLRAATKKLDAHLAVPEPEQASAPVRETVN